MSATVSAGQLKSFVERIESLEAGKREVLEDIKQVYLEAKSFGFDVKILRKVVAERRKAEAEREEESALLDVYLQALKE